MSLDTATVRRVASLARLHVDDAEVTKLQAELNGILGWIEQLQAVNTDGVEPMAGGAVDAGGTLRQRDDVITDGGIPERVLANAPDREGEYFGVPKVVE
ncbi:MAG TPA: Asp-tRNA(Asn)/Glu-tRNA(Gln) amidotransferase subunit GatC [Roseomonas sp.]|jgi:aspartyl-tRNA(Asn)/glutamyl-tRNA(Gln) amidotransferase subunit C